MDTSKFLGPKTVTVMVPFTQPQFEEVRLLVSATSREDLTVTPDTFNFGQIKRGETPSSTVKVTFLGGGPPKIESVTCDSNYVQTTFKPLKRTETMVEYELTATVREDVPAGKWYTLVWIKTNDSATHKLSVPVTVDVDAPLDLSPAAAQLGDVRVGTQVERRLVLKGVQPFRVTEIKGTSNELQVKDLGDESKQMHVLIVTFKPTRITEVDQTLKIVTDLKEGNELEFEVHGRAIGEVKEFPLRPFRPLGLRKPAKD
jgi:hypothetical protein